MRRLPREGFERVNTHAAHHFLYLMRPCLDEVDKSLVADIGIEALYKVGPLCGYAPVAFAGLAGAAEMASQ